MRGRGKKYSADFVYLLHLYRFRTDQYVMSYALRSWWTLGRHDMDIW